MTKSSNVAIKVSISLQHVVIKRRGNHKNRRIKQSVDTPKNYIVKQHASSCSNNDIYLIILDSVLHIISVFSFLSYKNVR